MAGFTLETSSFGSRLFLKSSSNKIINTYNKALLTNGVKLELYHNNDNNYDFAISLRRSKTRDDDGLSYSYAAESIRFTPILNSDGYYSCSPDITEYFDECPRGTWQLQVFLRNRLTNLTEHFIYIDLVFSNNLQVKYESTESKELQIKNYFQLSEDNNIIINNATGNLYYQYLIYRKVNNDFIQHYRSETYTTNNIMNINWMEVESDKTIEKHILTGLSGESHVYILLSSDSKQFVEFTYLKYKLKRSNNLEIVGNSNEVYLGEKSLIPSLRLVLKSKFEPDIIPYYAVKCDWMLLDANKKIKRTLLNINFDNKINNTATKNGIKEDIIIPDVLSIDSHLSKDFWNTKILPENYLGEYSNDVLIRVTVTGFDANSLIDLNNQSICVDEVVCEYYLTRVSTKPLINIKDTDLGFVTVPPVINYMITDNDSPKLIVKETIDLNGKDEELFLKQFTINEINNKINFNASANKNMMFNTAGFDQLSHGKHTYSIYIGDGINEPSVTKITFEKLPNKPPIISGSDNTDIEEIYVPKEFKYTVMDPEHDNLTIEEYYDDVLLNRYRYTYSSDSPFQEKSINYTNNFKASDINSIHTVRVKATDEVSVVERVFTFKKIQGPPPVISGLDTDLKKIFKAKPIEYTVYDPSDGQFTITEYFDGRQIKKYSSQNKITSMLNYSSAFNEAKVGAHNIVITADNGYDTSRRTFLLEKISETIDKFLITPQNVGDVDDKLNIIINVWNILGNKMTYDILLNNNLISSNNEFTTIVEHIDNITKYKINYFVDNNSEEFKKLTGTNTIKFVIKDSEGCVEEITYTFNKINKSPKVTVNLDDFHLYVLQIKNQIVKCYNKNDAKLVVKLNDSDITFGSKKYVDIPKNTFENQYVYLFSLSNELWNSLQKYSENKLTFILTDKITNETDRFEYRFVKGHNEILNWKPTVSTDGLLEWSVDNSQNIPQPVNIRGPIGKTPKIKIGNVYNIPYNEKPEVTIVNSDIENPILEFKIPQAKEVIYTSNVPSTVDIGGIEKGFISEGINILDLVYKMLHPYVKPNVSFSSSPYNPLNKLGQQLTVNNLNINISNNSDVIKSIQLFKNDTLLDQIAVTNSNQYIYNSPITMTNNTTLKLVVNDGKNSISEYINYEFVHPIYYGSTNSIPNSISGLKEELIKKSNKEIIYNNSTVQYQIFAYPKSYGLLSSIQNDSDLNCITGFNYTTINANNIEYYLYYTKIPSIINNYKYIFKFN